MTEPPKIRRSKFNTVKVEKVHTNVRQEVIEITADKLELILVNHINSVTSRKEWQAPLGILITILVVLCTAEFKTFAGVSADTWIALFLFVAVISFLWLIKSLWKLRSAATLECIINAAKNKN